MSPESQAFRKPFAIGACVAFFTDAAVSVGTFFLIAGTSPGSGEAWLLSLIATDALGAVVGVALLSRPASMRRVGAGVIAGTACAVAAQVLFIGVSLSNSQ